MNAKTFASLLLAPALCTLPACDFEGGEWGANSDASQAEMRTALIEVAELGDGLGAQDDVIELTTSFTLGQGVQAAAEEIRDFVHSQIPCSTVTVSPGQVEIDFGGLEDLCIYRGRTYAGVVTVQVELPGQGALVTHTYEGFTGGRVTMDGQSVVDWNDGERHIVTDLTFTSDERTVEVQSDRTQTFSACEGADAVCVHIEGSRQWTSPRGEWDMTIDDVHARSIDPVPESGAYTVVNPEAREIEMSFARQDEDTIRVEITGGRRDIVFDVTSTGMIEEAE